MMAKIEKEKLKEVTSYYMVLIMSEKNNKIVHICKDLSMAEETWYMPVSECGYGIINGYHVFATNDNGNKRTYKEMLEEYTLCKECGNLEEFLAIYREYCQWEIEAKYRKNK